MTREELEHIIRASADVTNQYEFVIIGSQSVNARPSTQSRKGLHRLYGGGHLSTTGS